MASIPRLCGPTDNEHCYSHQRHECRETLLRLKSSPEVQHNCFCADDDDHYHDDAGSTQVATKSGAGSAGSSRSCQDWYNLVMNHPCLYQQQIHPAFLPQYGRPGAAAFSFDLELANQLLLQRHIVLSCTSALHACRKSPLCRRVYDEFRRRCRLKDDRCRMTNAALCYNSYELIKLTPLWKCLCDRPSEKKCLRIQKSIIANACIVGSFPWLLKEDEETTTVARPTRLRTTITTRPPYIPGTTRRAPPPARPVQVILTSTAPILPDDSSVTDPDIDGTEAEETTAATLTDPDLELEPYPGPDEEFLLFPRIALFLLQPLVETIRNVLAQEYEMETLPPPPTTTPLPETEPVTDSDGQPVDGAETEPGAMEATEQAVVTVEPEGTPPLPTLALFTSKKAVTSAGVAQKGSSAGGTTPARSTRPTRPPWRITVTSSARLPASRTTAALNNRTISTTTFGKTPTAGRVSPASTFRPSVRTPTAGRSTAGPLKSTGETATPIFGPRTTAGDPDSVTDSSAEQTSASPDDGLETVPVTTTTEPDEPIVYTPDPRGLHSGACLTQMEAWSRQQPAFAEALTQYHNACRWHSDLNETCNAADCLDGEVRMQRWMGRWMALCRNLSCEGNPHCEQLLQMLNPGCVHVAAFLEEMDTELTITCRDIRRNIVLQVPRGHHRRVHLSETCSQLCTCDVQSTGANRNQRDQMTCYNLPCVESKDCLSDYATYPPGSPAYRAFQGACVCYASRLHCIRPYNYTVGKGAWLFMGYSALEESLMLPYTNVSLKTHLLDHVKKLPYPQRRTDTCLFSQVPSDPDYIVLKADLFEWDNSSENGGVASPGTLANEAACDKFFNWLANQISERRPAVRQDLLLALVKLAEAEIAPHTAPNAAGSWRRPVRVGHPRGALQAWLLHLPVALALTFPLLHYRHTCSLL
ncbi:uncharacterized protein LOC129587231 isoform X2 [Paramacrobiotus metropolitanus]|nr:uncharacterized protein LOC129587231 isoform X2 [Paramacrobiotus metropolitanus]